MSISNSGAPASSGEPSMEEILASIRRILKDDETATLAPKHGAPEEDVLFLDHSMIANEAMPPLAEHAPDAGPHAAPRSPEYYSPMPEARMELPAAAEQEEAGRIIPVAENAAPLHDRGMTDQVDPPASLLDEAARKAAAASFGALVRSVSAERAISVRTGGPTIEDMVRDELRPLLKSWLDSHLPNLVERVVRAEVQRLTERDTLD